VCGSRVLCSWLANSQRYSGVRVLSQYHEFVTVYNCSKMLSISLFRFTVPANLNIGWLKMTQIQPLSFQPFPLRPLSLSFRPLPLCATLPVSDSLSGSACSLYRLGGWFLGNGAVGGVMVIQWGPKFLLLSDCVQHIHSSLPGPPSICFFSYFCPACKSKNVFGFGWRWEVTNTFQNLGGVWLENMEEWNGSVLDFRMEWFYSAFDLFGCRIKVECSGFVLCLVQELN
jgi:hypothetical protein